VQFSLFFVTIGFFIRYREAAVSALRMSIHFFYFILIAIVYTLEQ
jgi:hypothetical protein